MSLDTYPLIEYPVDLACLLPGSVTLRVPILNEAVQITGSICNFPQRTLAVETDDDQITTLQLTDGSPLQVECYETADDGRRLGHRVFTNPVPFIRYYPEYDGDELPFWFAEAPAMQIANMEAFEEFTVTVGSYALRKCQQVHGLHISNYAI